VDDPIGCSSTLECLDEHDEGALPLYHSASPLARDCLRWLPPLKTGPWGLLETGRAVSL
jgi:hypothetical protein